MRFGFRAVKFIAFIASLYSSPVYAVNTCLSLFPSYRLSLSFLNSFELSDRRFWQSEWALEKIASENSGINSLTKMSIEELSQTVKEKKPVAIYRAMSLSPAELLNITNGEGLSAAKLKFVEDRGIYFSFKPMLGYGFLSLEPAVGKSLIVLFVVNHSLLSSSEIHTRHSHPYVVTKEDVPIGAITKIYIFDPHSKSEFPFQILNLSSF